MWAAPDEVRREMEAGSDRACAIIGGAYVEAMLADLLRNCLIADVDAFGKALDRGPLYGFDNKIMLAFLLGAISEKARDEANVVRKIRNHFAHQLAETTFEDPEILKLVRRLNYSSLNFKIYEALERFKPEGERVAMTPRQQFEGVVQELGGFIRQRHPTVRLATRPKY